MLSGLMFAEVWLLKEIYDLSNIAVCLIPKKVVSGDLRLPDVGSVLMPSICVFGLFGFQS